MSSCRRARLRRALTAHSLRTAPAAIAQVIDACLAVDPAAKPAAGEKTPPARDLTPYEEMQARIIVVPEKSPRHILVGMNDRNPQLHDVYRLDIETGDRELVFQNDANVAGWTARTAAKVNATASVPNSTIERDGTRRRIRMGQSPLRCGPASALLGAGFPKGPVLTRA